MLCSEGRHRNSVRKALYLEQFLILESGQNLAAAIVRPERRMSLALRVPSWLRVRGD